MNNNIAAGYPGPKNTNFAGQHSSLPALTRQNGAGKLDKDDLRALVAAMVD